MALYYTSRILIRGDPRVVAAVTSVEREPFRFSDRLPVPPITSRVISPKMFHLGQVAIRDLMHDDGERPPSRAELHAWKAEGGNTVHQWRITNWGGVPCKPIYAGLFRGPDWFTLRLITEGGIPVGYLTELSRVAREAGAQSMWAAVSSVTGSGVVQHRDSDHTSRLDARGSGAVASPGIDHWINCSPQTPAFTKDLPRGWVR